MTTFRLERVEDREDARVALSVWRAPELAGTAGRAAALAFLADDPRLRTVELWADAPEGRAACNADGAGAFFARAFRPGSGLSGLGGLFAFGEAPVQARFNEDRLALVSLAGAGVDLADVCERAAREALAATAPEEAYGLRSFAEDGYLRSQAAKQGLFDALQRARGLWRALGGKGNLGDFWAWAARPLPDALYPPGVLAPDGDDDGN